jgi:hypothetical protein
MAVGPTENRLESVVQTAERNRARHLDAPPDGRVDAEESDLQLVDGGFGFCGGHKRILSFKKAPAAFCHEVIVSAV